jgi:hypothetical protein
MSVYPGVYRVLFTAHLGHSRSLVTLDQDSKAHDNCDCSVFRETQRRKAKKWGHRAPFRAVEALAALACSAPSQSERSFLAVCPAEKFSHRHCPVPMVKCMTSLFPLLDSHSYDTVSHTSLPVFHLRFLSPRVPKDRRQMPKKWNQQRGENGERMQCWAAGD